MPEDADIWINKTQQYNIKSPNVVTMYLANNLVHIQTISGMILKIIKMELMVQKVNWEGPHIAMSLIILFTHQLYLTL